MKSILIIVTVACITGIFHNHAALAEVETSLGSPEMCLNTTRIKEIITLDDHTILFKMRGGDIYINRLSNPCPGLKISNGISYDASTAKICKQDIISLLWPGSVSGGKCGLGAFLPLRYEGKSEEAIKRLENGLLDELVATGAFKEGVSSDE